MKARAQWIHILPLVFAVTLAALFYMDRVPLELKLHRPPSELKKKPKPKPKPKPKKEQAKKKPEKKTVKVVVKVGAPQPRAKPKPKAQAKPKPKAQAQAQAQAKAKPKAKPKAKSRPTAHAKAASKPKAKARSEPGAQARARSKPKAQAQPKPRAQAKPKVQAQPTAAASAQASRVRPPQPVKRSLTVTATRAHIARGRQLARSNAVPEVQLDAAPTAYLRFYRGLGGRLFLRCGGRLVKEVVPEGIDPFRAASLTGLDARNARQIQGWSRGDDLLRRARGDFGLRGCRMVMLLPPDVASGLRFAVLGALEQALTTVDHVGIGDLTAVSGVYRFGRVPSVVLRSSATASGATHNLSVSIQLSGLW